MLPVPQMISKSEPTDPLWAISRAAATHRYRHLQSAQSGLGGGFKDKMKAHL